MHRYRDPAQRDEPGGDSMGILRSRGQRGRSGISLVGTNPHIYVLVLVGGQRQSVLVRRRSRVRVSEG